MASTTTAADALGCLWAVLAFSPVLFAPGFCVGWLADLLGFRTRPVLEQLAWAIVLSFAVVPIAAVLLAKYLGLNAVVGLCCACALAAIALCLRTWPRIRRPQGRPGAWALCAAAGWAAFVVAALLDLAWGDRLYLSETIFDHSLRAAFVDSVLRTGVPPVNPLFWPGHAAPMRYYYFWYVVAAAAARIGGVTGRQAMIASVVWAGLALAAAIGLFCRHFLVPGRKAQRSRIALGVALLAVTGLDILPALAKLLARMPADGDIEWWSGDSVCSWLDSLLWVPHHVAALVCCMAGFLLAWTSKDAGRAPRLVAAGLAGGAFASAFGLSTWVALAFAILLAAWGVWVLGWEKPSNARLKTVVAAACMAAVLVVPYIQELRREPSGMVATATGGGDSAASPGKLLRFGVRQIIPTGDVIGPAGTGFASRAGHLLASLALLVPGYFVELGFYSLLLFFAWRGRRTLDEAARTALFFSVTGIVLGTFVRSTVVASNDFGIRAMLIPQFFLLLLAVVWLEQGWSEQVCSGRVWSERVRAEGREASWLCRTAHVLLWLGVASSACQMAALRLYLPVQDALGRPFAHGLARRAMALRLAHSAWQSKIPVSAIVQYDPVQPEEFLLYAQLLATPRQLATALPLCPAAFGGDVQACARVQSGVQRLFPAGPDAPTAAQARALCQDLGIQYLLAASWEPVWRDTAGWVWTLPQRIATKDVRVLDCAPEMR